MAHLLISNHFMNIYLLPMFADTLLHFLVDVQTLWIRVGSTDDQVSDLNLRTTKSQTTKNSKKLLYKMFFDI